MNARRLAVVTAALAALGLGIAVLATSDTGEPLRPSGRPAPEAEPAATPLAPVDPAGIAEPAATENQPERELAPTENAEPSPPDLDQPAWLHGRVLEPDGSPADSALVGVVLLDADGKPPSTHEPVAAAHADTRGVFRLRPHLAHRGHSVLLLARKPGFRPASTTVTIPTERAPKPSGPVELRLRAGRVLAGRVVRNGVGVADVQLSLDLRFGTPGVFGVGREAFWLDGQLEEKLLQARTDANGAFRIDGLAADEYRLHVDAAAGRRMIGEFVQQVRAPNPNLLLDVTLAELSVMVTRSGRPLAGAKVRIEDGKHGAVEWTSLGDPESVFAHPSTDLDVRVAHDTSSTWRTKVQTPSRGLRHALVADLLPVERPSLRITLRGAAAAGIRRVRATLKTPRSAHGGLLGNQQQTEERSADLYANRVDRSDDFEFPVVPLDAGRYRLVVAPHQNQGPGHYLLPIGREIDLPVRGAVHETFELALAGRVKIDIRWPTNDVYQANYQLFDAAGTTYRQGIRARTRYTHFGPLQASIAGEAEVAATIEHEFGDLWLALGVVGDGPVRDAREHGVVPAGPYRLKVDVDGCEPFEDDVVVEPAKVNTFVVELRVAGTRSPSARDR